MEIVDGEQCHLCRARPVERYFQRDQDLLLVTRRLMALADEIQDAKPETASKLRAGIDLILRDTGEISKSVETAATLTANSSP